MEHWTYQPETILGDSIAQATDGTLDAGRLSALLTTELRQHGHFNNVLTHLSAADWPRVQKALARLLDWRNEAPLTPFETDLVSFLSGEQGVAGRLMRTFMTHQLRRHLAEEDCACIQRTWHELHAQRLLLPPRFRPSAMRVIRGDR